MFVSSDSETYGFVLMLFNLLCRAWMDTYLVSCACKDLWACARVCVWVYVQLHCSPQRMAPLTWNYYLYKAISTTSTSSVPPASRPQPLTALMNYTALRNGREFSSSSTLSREDPPGSARMRRRDEDLQKTWLVGGKMCLCVCRLNAGKHWTISN